MEFSFIYMLEEFVYVSVEEHIFLDNDFYMLLCLSLYCLDSILILLEIGSTGRNSLPDPLGMGHYTFANLKLESMKFSCTDLIHTDILPLPWPSQVCFFHRLSFTQSVKVWSLPLVSLPIVFS